MQRKGAALRAVHEQPAWPLFARLCPAPHPMATTTFGTIRGVGGRSDALSTPKFFAPGGLNFMNLPPRQAGMERRLSVNLV